MAKTDPLLAEHLKTATVFKGDSKEIQNDLISIIAEVFERTEIRHE